MRLHDLLLSPWTRIEGLGFVRVIAGTDPGVETHRVAIVGGIANVLHDGVWVAGPAVRDDSGDEGRRWADAYLATQGARLEENERDRDVGEQRLAVFGAAFGGALPRGWVDRVLHDALRDRKEYAKALRLDASAYDRVLDAIACVACAKTQAYGRAITGTQPAEDLLFDGLNRHPALAACTGLLARHLIRCLDIPMAPLDTARPALAPDLPTQATLF